MLLLLLACADRPADQPPAREEKKVAAEQEGERVAVAMPFFQLRKSPAPESPVIQPLRKGDRLALAGAVSENKSRLTIRGKTYHQAWLLVRTEGGKEGWVHAAAFADGLPPAMKLQAVLGPDLAAAGQAYQERFKEAAAAAELVSALRLAHQLCSQLELAGSATGEGAAELAAGLLPGLQPTWLPGENHARWYVDYRVFGAKAAATQGRADDELVELYYLAFPVDSIGYRYPGWMLEAEAGRAFSLLGQGVHTRLLRALDERLPFGGQIRPELEAMKQQLINDICGPGVLYWERRDSAAAEISRLIADPPACLEQAEVEELERRHQQLLADSTASATFNHRSGRPR